MSPYTRVCLSHMCNRSKRLPSRLSRRRKLSPCYSYSGLGGWVVGGGYSKNRLCRDAGMQAIKEGHLTRTSVALPIIQVAMEALGHLETSSQIPELVSFVHEGRGGWVLLFMLRGTPKETRQLTSRGEAEF